MDLVATAAAIPTPGQTVLGDAFRCVPGGKGANQAVAAARLGAAVAFVGRIGDDPHGATLRAGLRAEGIDVRQLHTTPGTPSGVALIVVTHAGENAICVAPGANGRVTAADVAAADGIIAAADVCVLQLELPIEAAEAAVAAARRHGVRVVLDPAPAPPGLPEVLAHVDVLTPNETESLAITGAPAGTDPATVAALLRGRGADTVVLKLGAGGAYLSEPAGDRRCPAHRVHVVDTTAAGDAFTAALAVSLAEGCPLSETVTWANAAGALACTRPGAHPAMPTRAEVEALLRGGRPGDPLTAP